MFTLIIEYGELMAVMTIIRKLKSPRELLKDISLIGKKERNIYKVSLGHVKVFIKVLPRYG
jgi:hypothetical protein